MSPKEPNLKVRKIRDTNKILKEENCYLREKKKNKALKKEIRDLRKINKYLISSKGELRKKYKSRVKENKYLKCRVKVLSSRQGEPILRHKYDVVTVNLCVSIYLLGGCSFRGVVRILQYLRSFLGLSMDEIPCKSSIENWVQKCGHYVYEHPDLSKCRDGGYCLIIDECMVIGQERMLVVLGVKASKEGKKALDLSQVEILSLQVKPSWNNEEVKEILEKVGEKVGRKADYIISDGGGNLIKGIKEYGGLRICDCGHEVARQTEQVYKDDERLKLFNSAAGQMKFKEVMKETGYLTPPKQRSIARFMNLSTVIDWAKKLLANFSSLTPNEQKAYESIKEHKEIIEELDGVLAVSNRLLKCLKTNGLSYKTIKECKGMCKSFAKKAQGLPVMWIKRIEQYLQQEESKLPDDKTVWYVSSDILESLFGKFKACKADNGLYGVTPFALILPIMTKIDTENYRVDINYRDALEGTFMSDLEQWNTDHLIENQVIKRRQVLKI